MENESLYEKVCFLIEENNAFVGSNIQKINHSYKREDLPLETPDYSGLSLEELYKEAKKLSKGNLGLAYKNLNGFVKKETGSKKDLETKVLIEQVEQEPEKTKEIEETPEAEEDYFTKIKFGIKSKLNKFIENCKTFGKGKLGKYHPGFGIFYSKKTKEQIQKELDEIIDKPDEKITKTKEGYFTKIKNLKEKYSKSAKEKQRIDEIITRARNIKRIRKKRLAKERKEQKKYKSERELTQKALELHEKQEQKAKKAFKKKNIKNIEGKTRLLF